MTTMFRRKQRPTPFPEPYRPTPVHFLIFVAAVLVIGWVH